MEPMTRLITTDLFFDPLQMKWSKPERIFGTPGITVAFFKSDAANLNWKEVFSTWEKVDANKRTLTARAFIDAALQNAPFDFHSRLPLPEMNGPFVDAVLNAEVITEKSPPESNPFSKLLGAASIITVGAAVGVAGFTGAPIMFVAVPSGILAVGATVVLLDWLRQLGPHVIERLTKQQPASKRRSRTHGQPRS